MAEESEEFDQSASEGSASDIDEDPDMNFDISPFLLEASEIPSTQISMRQPLSK